jgi:hypothetical protein
LLPDGSYGLPQMDERKVLELEGERYAAQRKRLSVTLRIDARKWISLERRSTLEGVEANIAALGGRLRLLHKEQGGLRLQ